MTEPERLWFAYPSLCGWWYISTGCSFSTFKIPVWIRYKIQIQHEHTSTKRLKIAFLHSGSLPANLVKSGSIHVKWLMMLESACDVKENKSSISIMSQTHLGVAFTGARNTHPRQRIIGAESKLVAAG
jgi:hypothetical protein